MSNVIELIRDEMDRHRAEVDKLLALSLPTPVYRPKIGVWVDTDLETLDEGLDKVGKYVDTFAIMAESMDDSWKWSSIDLQMAAYLLKDKERVLTYWPDRRGTTLYREAYEAGKEAAVFRAAVELDLEANWHGRLATHAGQVMAGLDEAGEFDIDVTTVPAHRENSPEATFYGSVRRLIPQAYTTYARANTQGLRPHELPTMAYRRATRAGAQEIGLGLAAWDQTRFPEGPRAAMTTAFKTALQHKPVEIRYWSLKHILRNDYALQFITEDIPEILEAA